MRKKKSDIFNKFFIKKLKVSFLVFIKLDKIKSFIKLNIHFIAKMANNV